MSDPTQIPTARPMTADDYAQGRAVRQARAAAPAGAHPTRDLVIGAVVGAVALWAVPKAMDFLVGAALFREEEDELELDEE